MTRAAYDVIGIGNAIVDVLAHADDEFIARHQLVKGSMQLVDGETSDRLYADMPPTIQVSGGSAANTLAGLASLKGKAAFIGKTASDHLGTVFSHDIRAAGVHFIGNPLPKGEGPSTARCLIFVTPDAQRTMNTYLGASIELGPDDVTKEAIEAASVTYVEGYLWDPPHAKAAIRKGSDIARAAGRRVAFSLSDSFCVDRHRQEFIDFIDSGAIDLVFANEAEVKSLFQVPLFDQALAACAERKHVTFALTRAGLGSVVIRGDEVHAVPAVPVAEVVDTTGAGDLYAAGFLRGYTRDCGLADCARLGALAASEVITHMGARPEQALADMVATLGLPQLAD